MVLSPLPRKSSGCCEKLGVACVERGENEAAECKSEYPAPYKALASADNTAKNTVCLAEHRKLCNDVEKLEHDLEHDPTITGELYRILKPSIESGDARTREVGIRAFRYALSALAGEKTF